MTEPNSPRFPKFNIFKNYTYLRLPGIFKIFKIPKFNILKIYMSLWLPEIFKNCQKFSEFPKLPEIFEISKISRGSRARTVLPTTVER